MKLALAFLAALVLSIPLVAQAQLMVADGVLDDWGVNPVDPTQYDHSYAYWLPSMSQIASFIEDDIDVDHTNPRSPYKVGPGYGGQNFDIERMYTAYDRDYLYIAIVTGVDQAGQWDPYRHCISDAGDVFVDLNCDGVWDFAIETADGEAGAIYRDASPGYHTTDWWVGGYDYNSNKPAEINDDRSNAQLIGTLQTGLSDGTYEAGDQFIYTNAANELDGIYGPEGYGSGNEAAYRADHNVVEIVIPWSIIASYWTLDFDAGVHYCLYHSMACGNDCACLCGPCTMIPEPSAVGALMFGSMTLMLLLKRRKRS
jgi:hypothetical protein